MKKTICVVVPTYNENDNVRFAYDRLCQVFDAELPDYSLKLLFADNCSTDGTRDRIRLLCAEDKRVAAILNTTNVGYARSAFYALTQAPGDAVVLMSADLQEPPEVIPLFVREWEAGFKVVCGVKKKSKESPFIFFIRRQFYKFLKSSSGSQHIEQFNGFGLYDASFIEALKKVDDPLPYLRGIVAELGPSRTTVEYTQNRRDKGKTHYNFWGLYDFAMHGITSSSKGVLRIATVLGFAAAIVCVAVAVITLVNKLLHWNDFQIGVAALATGLFFIGAVMLFYIGLLGEYIMNINVRVMRHPLVVEEERINL